MDGGILTFHYIWIIKETFMKKAVPNIITSLSLLTGSVSIIMVFQGNLYWSGWFIIFAAVFDFFDGFAARTLNAISPIGKFLDSLSDLVSFGVAPAMVYYFIIQNVLNTSYITTLNENASFMMYFAYVPVLLILASAFRLARFTVNSSNNECFEGVPTTAVGIFSAAIAFLATGTPGMFWAFILTNIYLITLMVVILSVLEVVKLPMINLKFKNYSLKENAERYILIIASLPLLLFFKWEAIPLIMAIYVLLSLISLIKMKKIC